MTQSIVLPVHSTAATQNKYLKMKLPGYLIVLLCSLGLALSNISKKRYFLTLIILSGRISWTIGQGLLLLVYPLLGHLADVYLTRYRVLKASSIILTITSLGATAYEGIDSAMSIFGNNTILHHTQTGAFAGAGLTFYMIGLGLFEANIIQFGLDQLLEAPTPKLIAFIHWYYWAQSVGGLALFYVYEGYQIVQMTLLATSAIITRSASITATIVLAMINIMLIIAFCVSKKHFYIEKAGLNPFKNIYKVLKYSWKHKVPERRSAFTYWEEDIPRRIDLGKNKYGGPFTNEEVEDTKTFLRILPLLLCLFGYHLAGDGYSATIQLQRTSCPSLPVLLLIVINPQHMTALVTVVGIPLYRLVIMKIIPKVTSVRMFTKMWIGLYLSLIQVVLYIIVVVNHDTSHWPEQYENQSYKYLPGRICIREQLYYRITSTLPVNNIYFWFIIPQLLNGLSSLLVSMTVFEFICAQAPRTTQGLLIGLWYATFSIRYITVGLLDNFITQRRSWLICEGVKGFLILVSLVLFSCVSRCYRYRQRDEIINVQGMIEEIYERRLAQHEEYLAQQEHHAILQTHENSRHN